MRKILLILAAMTLLLAACNSEPNAEMKDDEEVATNEVEQEEVIEETVDEETEAEADLDASEDEVEKEAATGVKEAADKGETKNKKENKKEDNKPSADNTAATPAKKDAWEKPSKIDNMKHLEIVHLAYDILAAQDRKDYNYLESVAAKGTTIDRKQNKFHFENVTYPFEMNFFRKEELDNLEVRYTHEEDGIVHVGIAVTNYEAESSFVIEFEFIKESSKWKLLSMDLNA